MVWNVTERLCRLLTDLCSRITLFGDNRNQASYITWFHYELFNFYQFSIREIAESLSTLGCIIRHSTLALHVSTLHGVSDAPMSSTDDFPRLFGTGSVTVRLQNLRAKKGSLRTLPHDENVRINSLPQQLDHTAVSYVLGLAGDTLVGIEALQASDADAALCRVLDDLAFQQPRYMQGNATTGTLRSQHAVRLASHSAVESRPGIEESGTNDYDHNKDTKKCDFDLGFIANLMNEQFIMSKSATKKSPSFLSFLKRKTKIITGQLLHRNKQSLQQTHFQIFSLAHRLDRIGKCEKYIDAWTTKVAIEDANDRDGYMDLRSVVPKSWIHDAEEEVLARKHATMDLSRF